MASVSLGPKAGLTVASALLVDYVLTVAVSVSSGVQNAATALPFLRGHEAITAVVIVALLTAMNLRGVRESGSAFAVPTYLFMGAVIGMAGVGFFRSAMGNLPLAESANLTPSPRSPATRPGRLRDGLPVAASLLVRVCGTHRRRAISNGVPAFQKPKSRNAARPCCSWAPLP